MLFCYGRKSNLQIVARGHVHFRALSALLLIDGLVKSTLAKVKLMAKAAIGMESINLH